MRYLIGLGAAALVALAAYTFLSSTRTVQQNTVATRQAAGVIADETPVAPAPEAPAPAAPIVQTAKVVDPKPSSPMRIASLPSASKHATQRTSLPREPQAPAERKTMDDAEPVHEKPVVRQPSVPAPAPVAASPMPAVAPQVVNIPAPAPLAVEKAPALAPASAKPVPAAPVAVKPAPIVAFEPAPAPPAAVAPVPAPPAPVVMAKVMLPEADQRPMPKAAVIPVEKSPELVPGSAPADSVPVKSIYVYKEEKTAELIVSPADRRTKPRGPIQIQSARFKDLGSALNSIANDITAGTEPGKTLAVGDVIAVDDGSRDKHLGEIASEVLATKSITPHGPRVMERSQVTRILDEMNMSSLGLTQERSASKVGMMLGADYVIAGTVTESNQEALLTVTKVNVSDRRTVAVWEAHFPSVSVQPLADQYFEKRTKTDALVRSLIIPGWGQFYNGDTAKGAAFLGIGAGLVGITAYEYTRFQTAKDNYAGAKNEGDSVLTYGRAQTAKTQFYALAGITALFWGINGAEAYINGTSESKVRVQAAAPESGGQGVEVALKW